MCWILTPCGAVSHDSPSPQELRAEEQAAAEAREKAAAAAAKQSKKEHRRRRARYPASLLPPRSRLPARDVSAVRRDLSDLSLRCPATDLRLHRMRQEEADDANREDDEAVAARKRARGDRDRDGHRHKWEEDDDEEARRAEEARLRDQQEKEEFEERLRLRDEARTVKVAEPQMSRAQREEAERRSKAAEQAEMLPVLREVSRQQYLAKREKQKLDELKEAIQARAVAGVCLSCVSAFRSSGAASLGATFSVHLSLPDRRAAACAAAVRARRTRSSSSRGWSSRRRSAPSSSTRRRRSSSRASWSALAQPAGAPTLLCVNRAGLLLQRTQRD